MLAAGDIGACDSAGDEATASLLDGLEGTVFALGDLAYESGTAEQFAACYDPSWGRHRSRTWPVPGNHEYETAGAAPYFAYFGAAAGAPGQGWYSFDLGAWHLIALNSNCDEVGGCDLDSPQADWLRSDLATSTSTCTLAYWHHPRWSSGSEHGADPRTDGLWRILAMAGAELVLTGHDHVYERFVPIDADGAAATDGMVEFVVGTGGRSLYGFNKVLPTSATHDNATYGVLQLTLHPDAYDWEFVPASDIGFSDSGSADCR
ncbi:MAG: metallophosphoesterase [Chloroflexota bacterium]